MATDKRALQPGTVIHNRYRVEKVLGAVPGVTAVVVDLEAKTAVVTCEASVLDADLVAAVEKKGFKASIA